MIPKSTRPAARIDRHAVADAGGDPMPAAKKSRDQRAKEREAHAYGPHAAWLRTLRCVWTATANPVAAHVAHTKGAAGDYRDIVPMALYQEIRWHNAGHATFAAEKGTTPAVVDGWASLFWSVSPANPERLPIYVNGSSQPSTEMVCPAEGEPGQVAASAASEIAGVGALHGRGVRVPDAHQRPDAGGGTGPSWRSTPLFRPISSAGSTRPREQPLRRGCMGTRPRGGGAMGRGLAEGVAPRGESAATQDRARDRGSGPDVTRHDALRAGATISSRPSSPST